MRLKRHTFGLLRPAKTRIAVTGMQASGKSVLLTALLDNLRNCSPAAQNGFKLGNNASVRKFEFVPRGSKAFPEFPFERHRSELCRAEAPEWPEKDTAITTRTCCFELVRNGKARKITWEVLDFPGDRLADGGMYKASYEDWSDSVLAHVQGNRLYAEKAQAFLDALGTAETPEDLVREYKLFLGRALLAWGYCVTPSMFRLDADGVQPEIRKNDRGEPVYGERTVREWAASRPCGLDPQSEFAPLSAEARKRLPRVAKMFAKGYKRYRRKIVKPLFDWLTEADSLVYTVDVLEILMAGTHRYNDELRGIGSLLSVCPCRKAGWRQKCADLLKTGILGGVFFWPGRLSKLAFVATKQDLIHPDDVSRYKHLLKRLVGTFARDCDLAEDRKRTFTVASVAATEVRDGKLCGRPVFDASGRALRPGESDLREMTPDRLPEEWPREKSGEFNIIEVHPQPPHLLNQAPPQTNLEKLADFLLGIQ